MGKEINLLRNYPQSKRNVSERGAQKTEGDRKLAREFGKEFFDGDRKNGYGGFFYNSRFWENVIPDFQHYYGLNETKSILDVGCAKGFMLYDFKRLIPGLTIRGIDISEYAISNALDDIKEFITVANAKDLPFSDNNFDLVVSINTIHNLELAECAIALKEIERVSKGSSFITLDAYRNEEEKKKMYDWNLTAKTIMSVPEWIDLFHEVGYTGDYYWFIP